MHDTPSKNLFGEDFRFHSSGCVRVQNVRELVNWLLVGDAGLVAPGDRPGDQERRAQGRQAAPSRCRSTGSMSPPGRRPTASSSSATTSTTATASARRPPRAASACPKVETGFGKITRDKRRLIAILQRSLRAPPARPSFRTARSSAWSARAAWCRRSSASGSADGRASRAGTGSSRSPARGCRPSRCRAAAAPASNCARVVGGQPRSRPIWLICAA